MAKEDVSNEVTEFMAKVGGAVIAIPVLVPVIGGLLVWRGYVLSILWGWFVVPMGVMPLSAAHAAGLCLGYAFMGGYRESKLEHPWKWLMWSWIVPAGSLAIGYVVRWYMG